MLPVLIYDGNCRLCEEGKTWIQRWDRIGRVKILHFEDPQAISLQPDLDGLDYLEAIRYIDPAGRVWEGPEGVIHLLKALPFGRPAAWFLSLPGVFPLAHRAYWWVAKNRYEMFGRV